MKTQLMVRCGFSGIADRDPFTLEVIPGALPSDPEGAAAELQQSGYEISRANIERDPIGHPDDDCYDAIIVGSDDPESKEAVRQAVEDIIVKYNGEVVEWGVLGRKVMALVAFSGDDPELDPERARTKLQRAGYAVALFSAEADAARRAQLAHPQDDFIEAIKIVASEDPQVVAQESDAIWGEVQAIIRKYGGYCDSCGPVADTYVPFGNDSDVPLAKRHPPRSRARRTF